MTSQDRIASALARTGLPAKQIHVYGSQIVVTATGETTARKWASVIARFATVRGMVESTDYNKVNTNTTLLPSQHRVFRVYGRI